MFCMQTCPEVPYKLQMVLGSFLTLCFAPQNLPKHKGYSLGVLAENEAT